MKVLTEQEIDEIACNRPDYATLNVESDDEGDIVQAWILDDCILVSYGLGTPIQLARVKS